MSTRYEVAPDWVTDIALDIKNDEFPHLDGANILVVMDTKKKLSGGRIVVARIKKMNDELKFFTMNDMGIEYDYVIFIDKIIFNELDQFDRKRIIYHELCHTDVDHEKKNPYGIKDHEIQGFYDEISYNEDDPRWSERVSEMASSIYAKD